MIPSRARHTRSPVLLLVLLALFLPVSSSGCARITPTKATAFQDSVTAATQGLHDNLQSTLDSVKEAQLQRVLVNPSKTTLLESDFDPILTAEARAALFSNLDLLKSYADLLRSVADQEYRGKLSDASAQLSAQASTTAQSLSDLTKGRVLSAEQAAEAKKALGIFSAIASVGGEVGIDLFAQRKAFHIVKDHDAGVAEYISSLQTMVHPTAKFDPTEADVKKLIGLTFLTHTAMTSIEAGYNVEFKTASDRYASLNTAGAAVRQNDLEQAFEARKRAAEAYRDILLKRQNTIASLMLLREGIGRIASAHHALAEDDADGFWASITAAVDLVRYGAKFAKIPK